MKLRITGGYTAALILDLRDRRGIDLTGGTFKVALLDTAIGVDQVPAAGDAAWKAPTSVDTSTPGVAVITWAISVATGYSAGRYRAWAQATLSPFLLVAQARDETIELV